MDVTVLGQKKELTEEEWKSPKFWLNEVRVPEKALRKVDPFLFLTKYMNPFMEDLGKAIVAAKRAGQEFKLVAYISYPKYLHLGGDVENGERGEVPKNAEEGD